MFAEDIIAILDQPSIPCPECGGYGYTLLPNCPLESFLPSTLGHVHNQYHDMGGMEQCTTMCLSCSPWEPGIAHVQAQRIKHARAADQLDEQHASDHWWPSRWHLAEHPVAGVLAEVKRKRKIRPVPTIQDFRAVARLARPGQITTDRPIVGRIQDRVVTVPAYLVGRPVDTDEQRMVVRYDYLGSRVDVVFGPVAQAQFRFAHHWDDDMSTRSLIG